MNLFQARPNRLEQNKSPEGPTTRRWVLRNQGFPSLINIRAPLLRGLREDRQRAQEILKSALLLAPFHNMVVMLPSVLKMNGSVTQLRNIYNSDFTDVILAFATLTSNHPQQSLTLLL
jgi:hypothetical protein